MANPLGLADSDVFEPEDCFEPEDECRLSMCARMVDDGLIESSFTFDRTWRAVGTLVYASFLSGYTANVLDSRTHS